jgi:sigma-B regulation protein RsbU (phosphoserine phosphatase)
MRLTEKKHLASTIAFFALIAALLVVFAVYFGAIVNWANYPDFGFGWRSATGLKEIGLVTMHGEQAGLRVGDRILKVNGKDFNSVREFRSIMNRELGEANTYLLERDGQQITVVVQNTPSGFMSAFERSGFPFLLGICYALIGALVFLMKPHDRPSWVFFLFAAIFGLYLGCLNPVGKLSPSWLEYPILVAYCFTPAVFIHLALAFPQEHGVLLRFPYLQLVPYVLSLVLLFMIQQSTRVIYGGPRLWTTVTVVYMALGVLFFVASCLRQRLTAKSPIVKVRARMILLGFSIAASVPLLDSLANNFLRVYILPGFNYYLPFFIVFPAFVGYSIVKHDLFDIDAIIKRTYGYVLTTGAVAGAYGLFILVSNFAFGGFEFARSPFFPMIFILAVVFLFNPIRNRVQRVIDRVFYRLEYDYQETVHKISETMRSLIGLNDVGKNIMDLALGTMFIDSGSLLLVNRAKSEYAPLVRFRELDSHAKILARFSEPDGGGVQEAKGIGAISVKNEEKTSPKTNGRPVQLYDNHEFKMQADDPLIQKIGERKRELTIHDIQEDPAFEDKRAVCAERFEQLGATLVVPLIYEDRLIGLISLGQKKSGKYYRKEDINLLTILANQGAVAIENALMIEDVIEKERMEEELSIARDLQESMLPAKSPEIARFEIASLCIPAREVGGDFFDFIQIGDDKVGLVIADVTGKSVSGALVMSSSRSVFRMLSEERLGVGEIMIRANRRTKKDIKSGMFVALLYAVLDSSERLLSLCSAGQTQPMRYSAQEGKALLVETEGDTFPLGILDEAEYKETRVQLGLGDKVVFYTDGIVEAMNKEREIFGFERLLKLVEESQTMNAEALLKQIMESVNKFVGDAPQHDDLTAIVVTVTG